MQNLKNHGRHENLECGTDVHYPDPIIKEYDPLGHITGYACLLCKIAEKGLSQKKPSIPNFLHHNTSSLRTNLVTTLIDIDKGKIKP